MKTIPLNKGMVALVDDEDFEELSKYKWHAHFVKTDGKYRARRVFMIKRQNYHMKMHRQIMGVTDPKIQVDHKNRDTLDNRRENLRICNENQNQQNKKKHENCSSKYKGVILRESGKWRVRISIPSGKRIQLGEYIHEVDAGTAYNLAAFELFGEFARFNTSKYGDGVSL